MKRILYLPSWFPSRKDPYSGDFVKRHAEAAALYDRITVLYTETDDTIKQPQVIEEKVNENLAIYVCYFPKPRWIIPRIINKPVKFFFIRKICSRIFATNRPDFVHVHVPYKAGLIALWLKWKYDIKYFVTEHWAGYDKSNPDNFFSRPSLFRAVTRKILRNSKCVIPVSEDLCNKLKVIEPSINTTIIPNTVNETHFYFEETQQRVFRFVHYVSSYKGQKNSEGLLNVFSRLHKKQKNWECVMYGPVSKEIIQLSDQLGLKEKVRFSGEISYNKVGELVRSSSVFVSFSNYENQPCSILEALCCGVPVIATRVGGIPEIVNQHNGLLIEPKNETQLLNALENIIDNYAGYNRHIIAEEAKQKFSYNSVGRQLHLLYKT